MPQKKEEKSKKVTLTSLQTGLSLFVKQSLNKVMSKCSIHYHLVLAYCVIHFLSFFSLRQKKIEFLQPSV